MDRVCSADLWDLLSLFLIRNQLMTNPDVKTRVNAQEQQIDRALVELRRLIYQLLSEAASSGGDPTQLTGLKQRLHSMELRALENERKAATAQKRLVELQSKM